MLRSGDLASGACGASEVGGQLAGVTPMADRAGFQPTLCDVRGRRMWDIMGQQSDGLDTKGRGVWQAGGRDKKSSRVERHGWRSHRGSHFPSLTQLMLSTANNPSLS